MCCIEFVDLIMFWLFRKEKLIRQVSDGVGINSKAWIKARDFAFAFAVGKDIGASTTSFEDFNGKLR